MESGIRMRPVYISLLSQKIILSYPLADNYTYATIVMNGDSSGIEAFVFSHIRGYAWMIRNG